MNKENSDKDYSTCVFKTKERLLHTYDIDFFIETRNGARISSRLHCSTVGREWQDLIKH